MKRKLFDSFTNPKKVQFTGSSTSAQSVQSGLELGEIKTLYSGLFKYRCDVRLFTGEEYKKVRLPGPSYGPLGFFSGHKNSYQEGQLCLVGFIQNKRDNPIILEIYSFPGGVLNQTNLKTALDYDPGEVSTGHESGHKTVWEENVLKHVDKLKQTRFKIDVTKPPTFSSLEKAAQGETLKAKLEELIDIVSDISTAVTHLTVQCTAPGTSSGTPNNSTSFNNAVTKLSTLKATLPKILSEVLEHY
ncbi:hypothetical protein [Leptospira santarosai]|uniref:hypothetical protein n=1 Tax=Leptospira santarosai TaxID=28183 RepID=UPI0024AFA9DA|nr:hypothetical protein [Leptospira santarosai]MDI7165973.1 hypothetical protein [Leptospira santarosai]